MGRRSPSRNEMFVRNSVGVTHPKSQVRALLQKTGVLWAGWPLVGFACWAGWPLFGGLDGLLC